MRRGGAQQALDNVRAGAGGRRSARRSSATPTGLAPGTSTSPERWSWAGVRSTCQGPGPARSTVRGLRSRRYEVLENGATLTRHAFKTMLHGLWTRNYAFGLEGVGQVEATGISESSISRRFARMTQEALAELLDKPLDGIDLVVLYIGGVVVAEHTVVCALGIDSDDKKHVLGVWEGSTENAAVCKGLLVNLVERRSKGGGLLVVIDGCKAPCGR